MFREREKATTNKQTKNRMIKLIVVRRRILPQRLLLVTRSWLHYFLFVLLFNSFNVLVAFSSSCVLSTSTTKSNRYSNINNNNFVAFVPIIRASNNDCSKTNYQSRYYRSLNANNKIMRKQQQQSLLLNMAINDDTHDECPLDSDDEVLLRDCFIQAGYTDMIDTKNDGDSNNDMMGYYHRVAPDHAIINKVYVAKIESLRDQFASYEISDNDNQNNDQQQQNNKNVIRFNKRLHQSSDGATAISGNNNNNSNMNTHVANLEYNHLIENDEIVLVDTVRVPGMKSVSRAFVRAGPRKSLHFNPSTVNAAIVTCGGLCPGINTVIRELVHSLYYLYGANTVYGITGGFHGFHKSNHTTLPPIVLTNEMVENIHHDGGTILKSARGGFDITAILEFLTEYNIHHLYIIGGDGTHRAAYKIHQECAVRRQMNIAIAGIPKTIDNDIDYIDRSFGFLSAVEAAQASIRSAKTEAQCFVPNCVSVVKLMGRSAGFLAAFAAVGSGDVDAVLIPEVPIVLDGPDGILPFIRRRIQEQKYVVVVVAEGAGEELLGPTTIHETDAGGNKKLPEIGIYIRDKIQEHFHKYNETASIKYIDPSYTVRSVPSNAVDTFYCMQLAQNAVHGAMAGYTGFSVGLVNNRMVYLPIPQLVATSPRSMDPHGQTWERVLAMTGQPNTANYKYSGSPKVPIQSQ